MNLPASHQNKNTRVGPFSWKWSVLQNPDRETTNQSTGICLWLALPYKKNKVFERQVWRVQVAHLRVQAGVFKFYPSVLLSMIKTSQLAREKLDSYCKNRTLLVNSDNNNFTNALISAFYLPSSSRDRHFGTAKFTEVKKNAIFFIRLNGENYIIFLFSPTCMGQRITVQNQTKGRKWKKKLSSFFSGAPNFFCCPQNPFSKRVFDLHLVIRLKKWLPNLRRSRNV